MSIQTERQYIPYRNRTKIENGTLRGFKSLGHYVSDITADGHEVRSLPTATHLLGAVGGAIRERTVKALDLALKDAGFPWAEIYHGTHVEMRGVAADMVYNGDSLPGEAAAKVVERYRDRLSEEQAEQAAECRLEDLIGSRRL